MVSLRTIRRLEMIKMLSIRRFQKLLAGYFITAALIVFVYVSFYGRETSTTPGLEKAGRRDVPLVEEVNGSTGKAPPEGAANEAASVDELDRSIIDSVFDEKGESAGDRPETFDSQLQSVIEALRRARDAHTADDDYAQANATTEPSKTDFDDYADDYGEKWQQPTTATEEADMAGDGELVYFALDKKGAVYEDLFANYDDEALYEIPHILHQTWDSERVPVQVANFMASWLQYNPFWVHWFWTERGFLGMLLRHFPEYYDVYRKYEHDAERADMRKYFLLYKEGGVIGDLDLECVRHFDDALLDSACILAREPDVHRTLIYDDADADYVSPAFMACRPEHPFFEFVIDHLREYAARGRGLSSEEERISESTGTAFLSRMYRDYGREHDASDIYLAPAELFEPSFDPSLETRLRVKCNGYKLDESLSERQRRTCEGLEHADYTNTRPDTAYTYHHWLKTSAEQRQADELIDVRDVLPSITLFDH